MSGGADVPDPQSRALDRHLLKGCNDACLIPGGCWTLRELGRGEGSVGLLRRRAQQALSAPSACSRRAGAVARPLAGPATRLASHLGGPWIETDPRACWVGRACLLSTAALLSAAAAVVLPPGVALLLRLLLLALLLLLGYIREHRGEAASRAAASRGRRGDEGGVGDD